LDIYIYNQTLSIRNAGSGGIDWTATGAAEWIHLSASSGVAPADIDVTVNLDGLWTSQYRKAQITIEAPGSANSPVTIEITEQAINFHITLYLPMLKR
jgi:hypothetical protein